MTGICAALRCGLVACAIGGPVLATMLFAAAPAGAGLLRNAPGVGAVALAHRSLNENLVGGLTGAFKKSVEGFFSDDSGEVEAAWDDAAHAVGKTARDMIPGAWLLDRVGKRVKTAAENIRGFFGDARAALDPAGQAEAEVLDGDSLARPAVRPPPRQRAGETARQAGRSTGNDAWTEVMNERAPAPVDGDGAQRPTSGVPGGESMNERAGEAPRSGGGSQRQAGNDVSAGGDDWNALMNEWAEADPPGGGGSQRQAGNDISTGGDAWAEVMNERPGAGAPDGGGGADRSTGGDVRAEAMNERAEAATPTGGGSERPVESDVRAGNDAREEMGNEPVVADRNSGSAGRPDRQADALAQRAEERRAAPPRDVDPPSGSWSCEEAGSLAEKAIKEAKDRGTQGSGTAIQYCAAANIQRAVLWAFIQCLSDPDLGLGAGASAADRAGARRALRENISNHRRSIAQNLDGVRTLTGRDGACECWSRICAD